MNLPEKVDKCIKWLASMEHPQGGIRGAPNMPSYPEVTGYLIPNLLFFEEHDLAVRCVKWLHSIQNSDGSFYGWQSTTSHTFDTAMIVWGCLASSLFADPEIKSLSKQIYHRGIDWLEKQVMWDNNLAYMRTSDLGSEKEYYMTKADAMVIQKNSSWWAHQFLEGNPLKPEKNRLHYLAYAFEGLNTLDVLHQSPYFEQFNKLNKPYYYWYNNNWEGSGDIEVLGNLQMSILLHDFELFKAMAKTQNLDGSFPHTLQSNQKLSWTARYFLDAAWHFGIRR